MGILPSGGNSPAARRRGPVFSRRIATRWFAASRPRRYSTPLYGALTDFAATAPITPFDGSSRSSPMLPLNTSMYSFGAFGEVGEPSSAGGMNAIASLRLEFGTAGSSAAMLRNQEVP